MMNCVFLHNNTDAGYCFIMKLSIRKLTFNENLPLGFEIISIDHHYAQAKQNLRAPHRASFYCIIWFSKGCPMHLVDFIPIAIKPGSFLFVRKDAVQFFDQLEVFSSKVLIFTDAFFCESENDHLLLQSSPLFNDLAGSGESGALPATAPLSEVWALMEKEARLPADDFQPHLLKSYLYAFIRLAERELQKSGYALSRNSEHFNSLISFKNELDKTFKTKKAVSYYAQRLFVSGKILTRALKAATGKTPKQLIDERVVLEAKRLLVYSRISLKEIALSLGFSEPTNFNKFFKKHAGKTPSAFRAAYASV